MIQFVKYSPNDLAQIELQPVQEPFKAVIMSPGYPESLDVQDRAWTVLDGEAVVASGGFSPQWPGRSIAWALVGREVPPNAWPKIKNKIRKEVDAEMRRLKAAHGHARVELTVPETFVAGLRLAKLLGFEVEGPLRKWGTDGGNHFMFSRVA